MTPIQSYSNQVREFWGPNWHGQSLLDSWVISSVPVTGCCPPTAALVQRSNHWDVRIWAFRKCPSEIPLFWMSWIESSMAASLGESAWKFRSCLGCDWSRNHSSSVMLDNLTAVWSLKCFYFFWRVCLLYGLVGFSELDITRNFKPHYFVEWRTTSHIKEKKNGERKSSHLMLFLKNFGCSFRALWVQSTTLPSATSTLAVLLAL